MERLLYRKLLAWKASNYRKPLLLQGARQVGKTYLLKEFGRREFKQVHYINFEKRHDLDFLFKETFDTRRVIANISLILDRGDIFRLSPFFTQRLSALANIPDLGFRRQVSSFRLSSSKFYLE